MSIIEKLRSNINTKKELKASFVKNSQAEAQRKTELDVIYPQIADLALGQAQELIEKYNLTTDNNSPLRKLPPQVSRLAKIHWEDDPDMAAVLMTVPQTVFPELFELYGQGYIFKGYSGEYGPEEIWFVTAKKLRIQTLMNFDQPFYRDRVYPSEQAQIAVISQVINRADNQGDNQVDNQPNTVEKIDRIATSLGFEVYNPCGADSQATKIEILSPEKAEMYKKTIWMIKSKR